MDASEWFTDTVTVESPGGLAADGSRDLQWGSRRTVACRVTSKQQQVQRADGQVIMAQHLIRCATAIDVKDRVWLPGTTVGNAAQARRPLAVTSVKDLEGYVLYRVLLGAT